MESPPLTAPDPMPGFPDVVIVTGGASGIGAETARRAAASGARVGVFDRDAEAAQALADQLPGGPHLAVGVDTGDRAAVEAATATVAERLGAPVAVVAAAGIVSRSPLREVSEDEFARVLQVNVLGVQHTIAAAAPHLMAAGPRGAIVALGSVAASTGGGLMGGGVYATSKAAVVGLIRGYARELAPWGVRANVVAPGATATPMTAALDEQELARLAGMSLLGRLSTVEEIASTICFLLTPGAGSLTGQVIQPNGGVVLT